MKKIITLLAMILCFNSILVLNVSAKYKELKVDEALILKNVQTEIYLGDNVSIPEGVEYNNLENTICLNSNFYEDEILNSNDIIEYCTTLGIKKEGYYISGTKIGKIKSKINLVLLKPSSNPIVLIELIWAPNKATVQYNLNGGKVKNTGYTINKKNILLDKKGDVYTEEFIYNEKYSDLFNKKIDIYKKDYVFIGWSLTQKGDKLIYPDEATFKKLTEKNQNITLYAQWLPKNLKIIYKNPDDKSKVFTYVYKKGINYITKDNIYDINEKYHSFMGWSTKPKGKGTFIKSKSQISYSVIIPNLIGNKLYLYPVISEYILPITESKGYLYISSPYGERRHPTTNKMSFHYGIDLAAPEGTNIIASSDGIVVESTYSNGYGYYVTIRHYDGRKTKYAHCSELLVKEGEKVKKGQVIAKVGNTGMSTGSHLHFEIIINDERLNPEDYVDFSNLKRF
jgi:uncharacterized repeat protein (TIGR02543 family)